MFGRRALRRAAVGGLVVALLGGCTSVVSGVGSHAADSPRASTSHPSGSHPSTSAKPTLLRTRPSGPFGDLATEDLCHGIPMSSLSRWGYAIVHGWQTAGACYIDISVSDTQFFQLNTWISAPGHFDPGIGRPRTLAGGAKLYAQRLRKNDCERDIVIGDLIFETHTTNVEGPVSASVLCAASSAYAGQEGRAFASKKLPPRSLAQPSVLRYDLCALMTNGQVEQIKALASARRGSFLRGGGCFADGAFVEVSARVAFIEQDFPLSPANKTVHGHRLSVDGDHNKSFCEVVSRQGTTRDGLGFEILDVAVDALPGAPRQQLCTIGQGVAVRMLHAAGLR